MKLLFVHEKFGALAGAESNVLATATELKRRGHDVGILHGPNTGRAQTAWRNAFDLRIALEPGAVAQIPAVFDTFQPEVVYVHKLADLEVLQALGNSGVPIVRMVHDHDLYCMRRYKYNYFTRQVCERAAGPYCLIPCGAFLARNEEGRLPVSWVSYTDKVKELHLNKGFDCLVVASQFMKGELIRNGFSPGRIEIHPPVPRPKASSPHRTTSQRNLIIYAGQIVRGKGVDVLLRSLALVKASFECFVFGDGNHRRPCERLCRELDLTDRVHFKGYVPQEELNLYYREAKLMVVSSVWPEPFGAVGLEGMMHGLPVVAFDAGGIKEWLINGYNGYRVPWMDCHAFASRVEELLTQSELARAMGERGRQLVSKCYNFADYIDGLEGLFTRLSSRMERLVTA